MQIVVTALLTWVQLLVGRTVRLHSDNQATIDAVRACDQQLMTMCRIVYDLETKFAISIEIVHIKGT